MASVQTVPARSEVPIDDTWDLSSLCKSDDDWEAGLKEFEASIAGYQSFQGRLGDGPDVVREMLEFDSATDRLAERLGIYASLKTTEDQANSDAMRRMGRFESVASRVDQAASYIRPELMAIDDEVMRQMMDAEELADWRLVLERLLRYKPHTLSGKEERLIAMQSEMAQAASQASAKLTDADLNFGTVRDEEGNERRVDAATFSEFLISPNRDVRRTAFHQYYEQIAGHENTLAATLNGSIQSDVYYARRTRLRLRPAKALFADNVPQSVYDNLIASVRDNLPAVYRYYDVRRRKPCGWTKSTTTTPTCRSSAISRCSTPGTRQWTLIIESLAPLGTEYCESWRRAPRAVVRSLPEPGQAERCLQLRLLRRRSLHPDELQAGGAGRHVSRWPTRRATRCISTSRPRTSRSNTTTT